MLNVSLLRSETAPVKDLGYDLRGLTLLPPSPQRNALLAFLLWSEPHRLSQREACDLVDASLTYVTTLAALTAEERGQAALGNLKLFADPRRGAGGSGVNHHSAAREWAALFFQ